MKKSELAKIVSEYKILKSKLAKSQNSKIIERLNYLKHRYYHETGSELTD